MTQHLFSTTVQRGEPNVVSDFGKLPFSRYKTNLCGSNIGLGAVEEEQGGHALDPELTD